MPAVHLGVEGIEPANKPDRGGRPLDRKERPAPAERRGCDFLHRGPVALGEQILDREPGLGDQFAHPVDIAGCGPGERLQQRRLGALDGIQPAAQLVHPIGQHVAALTLLGVSGKGSVELALGRLEVVGERQISAHRLLDTPLER